MPNANGNGYDVDGSVLEGGGQILRIAVALSAITGRPLRIHKIRAGRKSPGLSNQHKEGIELVGRMCDGKLSGCEIRSQELSLVPGRISSGRFTGDSVTAGSVSLLLQVALPCALFADGPTTLRLRGGTNAEFAPPIDYVIHVFLHAVKRFGINVECNINRRGFYPQGGGEVNVKIFPVKKLSPITVTDRGDITIVNIYSYVAGQLPNKVAEQCADMVKHSIIRKLGSAPDIKINKLGERVHEATGTGTGVFIWAETVHGAAIAGSANGAKGKPNQQVAEEASEMFASNIRCCAAVDEHLQDQLIIFMALAAGHSEMLAGPLTMHTQTAIYVCQQILGVKFNVSMLPNGNCMVACDGIGWENKQI